MLGICLGASLVLFDAPLLIDNDMPIVHIKRLRFDILVRHDDLDYILLILENNKLKTNLLVLSDIY
jgi:hypothetical protein